MKKELREPIKDPSIFENEYFKVVHRKFNCTIYTKCDKITDHSINPWGQVFFIKGVTIIEECSIESQRQMYIIKPEVSSIVIHHDDLDSDIQFITQEEFDEVKQRVIDILS